MLKTIINKHGTHMSWKQSWYSGLATGFLFYRTGRTGIEKLRPLLHVYNVGVQNGVPMGIGLASHGLGDVMILRVLDPLLDLEREEDAWAGATLMIRILTCGWAGLLVQEWHFRTVREVKFSYL